MHQYYHIPGTTDRQKMLDEANLRTYDKRDPQSSIVHNHPRGGKCDEHCQTFEAQEV